jgi:hypothetical protein
MKFKIADGGELVAGFPSEILETLKYRNKFDFEKPNQEFMEAFSQKLKVNNGLLIRTMSVSDFISDLIQTQYLTRTDTESVF